MLSEINKWLIQGYMAELIFDILPTVLETQEQERDTQSLCLQGAQ